MVLVLCAAVIDPPAQVTTLAGSTAQTKPPSVM